MNLLPTTPRKSLNKAYLKEKVARKDIELFKAKLVELLDAIDQKESEEYVKNLVTKFLYDSYYNGKNQINTKGRIDLAIYEDKKPVVIIEAKRPLSPDMVTVENLNKKATHELMLYYLQERVQHGNIDIKYLIITNTYEWFIFDASVFDKLFYKDGPLMKDFIDWTEGRKARTDRDLFYNDIAKPFLNGLQEEIKFTWFDLKEIESHARNQDPKDDLRLIDLFKILSPAHLLKEPFANDSNSLDTRFYTELLHIIGLEEKKEGGKKLIQRKQKPDAGSLLENAINMVSVEDRLHKLPNGGTDYGATVEERLFNVALELCITWINRILFLKLLEGQLLTYHAGDKQYRFLDFKTIPDYDELNKLFFQVLARKNSERSGAIQSKYERIPYLNSSLFDSSALEDDTLRISGLDDGLKLKISGGTVLKTVNGKKREGEMPTLQYLFEFLDAYDFSSEGKEEIQEENKTLINASVLGLIFEKINGYKDGSFFTPGFITMYICRETIRRAVIQKFNEAKKWKLKKFEQLYNKIDDVKEANDIINSLKICDPAVGSGHFLVSALNEIIAIKSELGILTDRKGNRLREYAVEVVNDELIVSTGHNEFFEYNPGNKESQRVQEALFHEKQTLIENCLFGVDINPNSVKICRLRLWIELLKNAYYTTGSKYEELETLPNIDINIKRGNSLISRFPLDADLSKALKSIKYSVDDYRGFVNDYKNATDKETKRGFEKLIEQIKKDFRTEIGKNDPKVLLMSKRSGELYNLLNQARVFEPTEKEKKEQQRKKEKLESEISKLAIEIEEIKNSAIYKDAFEWRFEFPEVLDNAGSFLGFDVVIGNPPYIRVQELPHYQIDFYKATKSTAHRRIDISILFFELGFSISKETASLCFISSNQFQVAEYGRGLRRLILEKYGIDKIINFNDLPVFEEALTYVSIYLCTKAKGNSFEYYNVDDIVTASRNILPEPVIINLSDLTEDAWSLGEKKISGLLEKLKSQPKLDLIGKCYYGIVSGNDGVYIFDSAKIDETGIESEFLLPLVRAQDCQRYGQIMATKSILYPYNLINGKTEVVPLEELRSRAPKTFEYLSKNKALLINRKDSREDFSKSKNWYSLTRFGQLDVFSSKKIIFPGEQKSPKFGLSVQKAGYSGARVFSVVTNDENHLVPLLAILNSKAVSFLIKKTFPLKQGGYYSMSTTFVDNIPIPKFKTKTLDKISTLCAEILKIKKTNREALTEGIEKKIDTLVYQLYELTEEEIKIIEET
jgi:adenine-specific DNA-methyltransferase